MIWSLAYILPPTAAGIFLGYVIGFGRGENSGYKLGYHEGDFDARTPR